MREADVCLNKSAFLLTEVSRACNYESRSNEYGQDVLTDFIENMGFGMACLRHLNIGALLSACTSDFRYSENIQIGHSFGIAVAGRKVKTC